MSDRSEQASGLRLVLGVVRRRFWLALAAAAFCFSGAVGLALFLPDIYRASVTVLVDRPPDALTHAAGVEPEGVDARLQTISQEILSRKRLGDLIAQFDLYPESRAKVPLEALIERMRREIDLSIKGVEQGWGRDATISFVLSYRGRDPIRTAAVANALAAFYVEENREMRERQAARSADALRTQLDEMKTRLDEQEGRVAAFKTRYSGELPQQVEANLATLERLNSQLQLNNQNQIRAWERRERLLGESPATPAADDPESPATRLGRLRRELAELRRRYSERYPDVVRLRGEVAALEQQLAKGDGGDAAAGGGSAAPTTAGAPGEGGELGRLKAEEKHLREAIVQYERRVEVAPQRQQEFQELSRDYTTTRDLYDSLLKKYQEARLAEETEHGRAVEQFRVLDAAIPPREPVAPNRPWIVAMGLALSIGLAAGAMTLAEQLDGSFHSADDLRSFTRVPVLASIPPILTRADRRRSRLRLLLRACSVLLGMVLVAGAAYALAHRFDRIASILGRVRV